MQVNTVNVELSIAKSHYVGYMHVTIYKTQLQCQNLNYLTLKSSSSSLSMYNVVPRFVILPLLFLITLTVQK
jgi:hypothetical protein